MSARIHHPNRRDLLRAFGGTAAAAFGALGLGPRRAQGQTPGQESTPTGEKRLFTPCTERAAVSLVKGNDRREIVYQALKKIADDVLASIGARKKILVKPNFVSTTRELAATHVDGVRGILDFLKPHFQGQILVGESAPSRGGTFEGFKNFSYLPLEKEYGITLMDLNTQPWVYRYVFGKGHRPIPIRIISTFLDPDVYLISAARMKTHDRAVTTLSLKNVLLGAPLNDGRKNDKPLTHTEYNFSPTAVLHFNMFHLAQEIWPDLGVIDGFVAMEGNGPVGGTPVDARVALASLDPLALDTLATKLMGFDPGKILCLSSMAEAGMGQGDLAKVRVLGTPVEECQFKFKPNERLIEAYGLG